MEYDAEPQNRQYVVGEEKRYLGEMGVRRDFIGCLQRSGGTNCLRDWIWVTKFCCCGRLRPGAIALCLILRTGNIYHQLSLVLPGLGFFCRLLRIFRGYQWAHTKCTFSGVFFYLYLQAVSVGGYFYTLIKVNYKQEKYTWQATARLICADCTPRCLYSRGEYA